MTPRQTEKIKFKIVQIKRTLAAEKRKFGTYDDSRGLRYLPTGHYLKLQDFSGGLAYVKWFQKNFPDDSGFPDFLFEWTVILFKNGKLQDAGKKAFQTYCRNTYVFDKFFGKPIVPIEKLENSNVDIPEFAKYFNYSSAQLELADFTEWLSKFMATDKFVKSGEKFIEIYKRLKTEDDRETRHYLIQQASQLKDEF